MLGMVPQRCRTPVGIAVAALCAVLVAGATQSRASTSATGVIVFDTSEGGGTPRIYAVRPDGSHLHQLANTGAGAFSPRLAPDGRRVTYVSDATGNEEIYVIGVGGAGKRQITHNREYSNFTPTFTPDGTRIAFSRCSNFLGTCDIAVIGVSGRGLHILAAGNWHHGAPAYSPDGDRIAFGSDEGGFEGRVRVMSAGGGRSRAISPVALAGDRPDWSPDGRWITYIGNLRHGQTFLCRPDGSRLHAITQAGEELIFAVFSPNGRMLVAENAGAPERGLVLMNADGGQRRTIPNLPAGAGFPDWGAAR